MASNLIHNIVLCLDDEAILSLLQAALEAHDCVFLSAHSGREALRLAAEHRADGVIFDQQLLDMTSVKLAAEIKHIRPDTAVIMFSGSAAPPPDAVEFVDTFLQKGGGVRPLLAALRRILGRSQPEARQFPRYPVHLPMAVVVGRFGETAVLSGICSNVGEGGIRGEIEGNLVPGEIVHVEVSDSRLKIALKSNAQVRHRTGKAYGFAFCDVTLQKHMELRRLCERLVSA